MHRPGFALTVWAVVIALLMGATACGSDDPVAADAATTPPPPTAEVATPEAVETAAATTPPPPTAEVATPEAVETAAATTPPPPTAEVATPEAVETATADRVPFPDPGDGDALVLERPRSLADVYDLEPVDDFVIYDDGERRITMVDAFLKQGRTFGYVSWDDGTRSGSQPTFGSHELAQCAAEELATDMDRFDAELLARGATAEDIDINASPLSGQLLDLYLDCGGTEEMITSIRDELVLGSTSPFDLECFDTTVSNADHVRTIAAVYVPVPDTAAYIDLLAPCFEWAGLIPDLSEASLACLDTYRVEGMRLTVDELDEAEFVELLESCLTPGELERVGL